MNGAELSAIALRLEEALARAGLQIQRGTLDRSGNRQRWQPVTGQELVVLLLAKGWVVGARPDATAAVPDLALDP